MDKWNNYETLEPYRGKVWISKTLRTKKAGNICLKHGENFRVAAYISPDQLEGKSIHSVIQGTLKAQGYTDSIYF